MKPTAWMRASTRSALTPSSWKRSATVRVGPFPPPDRLCSLVKRLILVWFAQSRRGRTHRWWSCRPWGACSRPTSTSSPSWRTSSRPCFVTAMRSVRPSVRARVYFLFPVCLSAFILCVRSTSASFSEGRSPPPGAPGWAGGFYCKKKKKRT